MRAAFGEAHLLQLLRTLRIIPAETMEGKYEERTHRGYQRNPAIQFRQCNTPGSNEQLVQFNQEDRTPAETFRTGILERKLCLAHSVALRHHRRVPHHAGGRRHSSP